MSSPFRINRNPGAAYLTLTRLEGVEGIKHGFTIKGDNSSGSTSGFNPLFNFASPQDRRRFMEALNFSSPAPAMVRQMHSDRVLTIRDGNAPGIFDKNIGADAIITNVMKLPIALLTADCLPLLLFNREAGAVGIAHAGRRGALQNIAGKTVQAMAEAFGADPRETLAAFGPAIGPCCYEVGQEVADEFRENYPWWEQVLNPGSHGKYNLDLFETNRIQLKEAGLPGAEAIEPGPCTSCNPSLFHSYRRDGKIRGHIFSFIMLDE